MYVTVLPVASRTYFCSPKANHTTPLLIAQRVLQLISGFGLSINGKHTYCGDYIYSGHTVMLVLSYLVVSECTSNVYNFTFYSSFTKISFQDLRKSTNYYLFSDSPKRFQPLHWLVGLTAIIGAVFVLIARGHYTVDVLIAYYVTTRLWYIYHTLANNTHLKVSTSKKSNSLF